MTASNRFIFSDSQDFLEFRTPVIEVGTPAKFFVHIRHDGRSASYRKVQSMSAHFANAARADKFKLHKYYLPDSVFLRYLEFKLLRAIFSCPPPNCKCGRKQIRCNSPARNRRQDQ